MGHAPVHVGLLLLLLLLRHHLLLLVRSVPRTPADPAAVVASCCVLHIAAHTHAVSVHSPLSAALVASPTQDVGHAHLA